MGTITSNTATFRSGSAIISISHPDLTGGSSFDIEDIGTISADFDIEEETNDSNNILFDLGEFEFTAFDGLDNNNSLFDTIDTDLVSTDTIEVDVEITLNSGRSFTDKYSTKKDEIEYEYLGRRTTFTCTYRDVSTDTVIDIFTDNPGDVDAIAVAPSDQDCMNVKAFINNTLSIINPDNDPVDRSFVFTDDGKGGGEAWVVGKTSSGGDPAIDMLFRIALFEGAIIGSMMGYNFYVHRQETTAVSLNEDDVKSIKISSGINSYYTIKAMSESSPFGVTWASFHSLLGEEDDLNNDALRVLHVYFGITVDGAAIASVTWDGAKFQPDGYTRHTESNGVVDADTIAGSFSVPIDDGSGGTPTSDILDGDLVYFGSDKDRTYEAESMSATLLNLKEPLRANVPENSTINVWNSQGNRNLPARKAAEAWSYAYEGNGARRIEIEIFGVETISPYDAFTFDSSFQGIVAGETFRPSKITYDLKKDTIKIEAYQIG